MTELPDHVRMNQQVLARQAAFWEQQYPELAELGLNVTPANSELVCAVYGEHIRLIDPRASVLTLSTVYRHLVAKAADLDLGPAPRRLLAQLYLDRGFARKALEVLEPEDDLYQEAEAKLQLHFERYGCDVVKFSQREGSRGMGLVHYFAAHRDLIQGKSIFHIAPEPELFEFFKVNAAQLDCTYRSMDGGRPGMVEHHDICAMDVEDDTFDLIICHRVIEHVADEASALCEMHRVLKPGGLLNISAPEALYLDKTADWVVPDPDIHGHIRTYGMDFAETIAKAGFQVRRENWLTDLADETLFDAKAVPTGMYNALKI